MDSRGVDIVDRLNIETEGSDGPNWERIERLLDDAATEITQLRINLNAANRELARYKIADEARKGRHHGHNR